MMDDETNLPGQETAIKSAPHGCLDTILLVDGCILDLWTFTMEKVVLCLLRYGSNEAKFIGNVCIPGGV